MAKNQKSSTNNSDDLPDLPDDDLEPAVAERPEKMTAKMRVEAITPFVDGTATVSLRPVTSGSPENAAFYAMTPGGAVSLGLVSEATARLFVLNADYMVTFTPA